MRDRNRIGPFCDRLKDIWSAVPDWRFLQFIVNAVSTQSRDPFFIEDDDALNIFEKAVTDNKWGHIVEMGKHLTAKTNCEGCEFQKPISEKSVHCDIFCVAMRPDEFCSQGIPKGTKAEVNDG